MGDGENEMNKLFEFGESHVDYTVRVVNEREARAAAGLFFVLALVGFMQVVLKGNFGMTQFVVLAFFVDFFIRVLVNPRFAPSLVLGRLAVRKQVPEYVGAPQKRFAWGLGLAFSAVMLYLLVLNDIRGPVTMVICMVCLILLFFETSFGICLGCLIYKLFYKEQPILCPGGVCEVRAVEPIQRVSVGQILSLVAVLVGFVSFIQLGAKTDDAGRASPAAGVATPSGESEADRAARCKVPALARWTGHENMWKTHNNCL
jgi:Domain of unknown function (DUF4395)